MRKVLLAAVAAGLGLFALAVHFPAHAADLSIRKAPEAVLPTADPFSGFYIGADIGYGWNRGNIGAGFPSGPADFGDLSNAPQGILGGAFLGWGTRFGTMFYFGLEGDGQIANLSGTAATPGLLVATTKNNWLASARGRLGVIVSDLLLYGTAGWGWGSSALEVTDSTGAAMGGASTTQNGFTWGLGVEHALFPNLLIRLEYLQYDFGQYAACVSPCAPGAPPITITNKDRIDTVRGGLIVKF